MKKLVALVMGGVLLGTLFLGCNERSTNDETASEQTETPLEQPKEIEEEGEEAQVEIDPVALSYADVLDSLAAADGRFSSHYPDAQATEFALAELNEDEVPELLVAGNDGINGGLRYVSVYYYDQDVESASLAEDPMSLMDGDAGASSYRSGLTLLPDGQGLLFQEFWSGGGSFYQVTLANGVLNYVFPDEGQAAYFYNEQQDIVWHALAERENLANGGMSLEEFLPSEPVIPTAAEAQNAIAEAQAQGLQVYSGVLRCMEASDLADYEERPQNIRESLQIDSQPIAFYILEFNEPQTITTVVDAGNTREEQANHICVARYAYDPAYGVLIEGKDVWKPYRDMQVVIAVDALAGQTGITICMAPDCLNPVLLAADPVSS